MGSHTGMSAPQMAQTLFGLASISIKKLCTHTGLLACLEVVGWRELSLVFCLLLHGSELCHFCTTHGTQSIPAPAAIAFHFVTLVLASERASYPGPKVKEKTVYQVDDDARMLFSHLQ